MTVTKTTTLTTSTLTPLTLTREFPKIIVGGELPTGYTLIGFAKDVTPDPDDIVSLNEATLQPAFVVGLYPVITDNKDGVYSTLATEVRTGWNQDPRERGALGPEDFHFAVHELMGEEFYENDTAPGFRLWAPQHHVEDVWMVTGPKGSPRLFTTMYSAIAYIMRAADSLKEEGN